MVGEALEIGADRVGEESELVELGVEGSDAENSEGGWVVWHLGVCQAQVKGGKEGDES